MIPLDKIKHYFVQFEKIQTYLKEKPGLWDQCQKGVDFLIDALFKEIADFEKMRESDEKAVYEFKRVFFTNFHPYFALGRLNRMVIEKPFGYHGDFFIIDEIYRNQPTTSGLERCLDNYFLKTAASIATRNRKEDFKKFLAEIVLEKKGAIRMMDLASGPCRDVQEFFLENPDLSSAVQVDCVDHDPHAIAYGKDVLKDVPSSSVRFIQKNAMRIALAKNVESYFKDKYDIIFSTGLFDYLDERIAVPLIANLKKILCPNGVMIISNYRGKWDNVSRHYMEWGGGWDLVYRSKTEFLNLFTRAGFPSEQLSLRFEDQKVMQYCFAENK